MLVGLASSQLNRLQPVMNAIWHRSKNNNKHPMDCEAQLA